jgi:hypothetical protein
MFAQNWLCAALIGELRLLSSFLLPLNPCRGVSWLPVRQEVSHEWLMLEVEAPAAFS